MSRQTLLVLLVIAALVAGLIALSFVNPEVARVLSQGLRLLGMIGRAFG